MNIRHFFLPHPKTHQKAHLLSWKALLIYLLFFLCLKFSIETYSTINPGVLGITSKVDQKELINLTNLERQKRGLSALQENVKLDIAALNKAKNMFEENYWAHKSPSGKDPWGFIKGAGYEFSFAGENLARNFYTSEEVVDAWVASPSHRDNLLNSRYQEIGIAVVEGVLKGQKTILVVQEFGSSPESVANLPKTPDEKTPGEQEAQRSFTFANNPADVLPITQAVNLPVNEFRVDPYQILKLAGLSLMLVFSILLALDFVILRQRGVYRLTSRHLPHLVFLGITSGVLFSSNPGGVL